MIELLLQPFTYEYMLRAIWISALVGGVCAFLSCFLILKGWSLMGDALSHSVVPGVALAYMWSFPFAIGAFFAGGLAALGMALVRARSPLREDAVIGVVFTSFFAFGLLIVSLHPTSVNVQRIILGNILAIPPDDVLQVVIICVIAFLVLLATWRDLLATFFDERHARSIGLNTTALKVLFFTLLSAATVAALQTVGAVLVIAMVVTPGATAYLLTDRFGVMISIAVVLGAVTGAVGAYVSFFLDGATGGLIVVFQTLVFLAVFVAAPKHGLIATRRTRNEAAEDGMPP
jgi:manganese/iron transport system permease protein